MRTTLTRGARVIALLLAAAGPVAAQVTQDVPAGRPEAIVDLTTSEGVRLVGGQWRFADARVVEVAHRSPGPDLRPSGPPNRTHDIEPKAGAADFDDSAWEAFDGPELVKRRTGGRLSFGWYRLNVTIPERIGSFDPTGSTVVFEVTVDDYAEIWVDGRLTPVLGQSGGALIKGWNAPNRVVLTRNARPGQRIQLAVFGANGPLSDPPVNFVWVRSATLDFYRAAPPGRFPEIRVLVDRKQRAIDALVPAEASVEKLAGGFTFVEGPVWVRDGGYLLFSDPNENSIYRWTPDGQVSVWRTKSGYSGTDIAEYRQPGSNGIALDAEGRVTFDQHGNRRVLRIERNGSLTVLADRYEGRRLNSPNDLVYRSDGSLYFTDPPFGLPKVYQDPRKELPFSGIYRVKDGRLDLLARDLAGPNGIAFSPDERYLYVGNWDPARKVIMRYEVTADGALAAGRVFFDITRTVPGDDAWDGIKVDAHGNVYAAGPEGIYVLNPDGKHLGTIRTPEHVANFAFGDDDGRSLYITATSGLYRMRLLVPGATVPTRTAVR
ncbi:MAG TPA: SMP-30/gluconolactonase/LRE family protein [Gemmatimonadales bacterium]|nr:SMP-30/gluconolactonase/LRE family protein [Gemmatimonadales bacterium]